MLVPEQAASIAIDFTPADLSRSNASSRERVLMRRRVIPAVELWRRMIGRNHAINWHSACSGRVRCDHPPCAPRSRRDRFCTTSQQKALYSMAVTTPSTLLTEIASPTSSPRRGSVI
jgi:hypothetical protein